MDIVVYTLMTIWGLVGTYNEIRYKKTNKIILVLFEITFLLLAVTRVIRAQSGVDLGDLSTYLYAYRWADNKYFEPGYIVFSNIIRWFFADGNGIPFIAIVVAWFIYFTKRALRTTSNCLKKNALIVGGGDKTCYLQTSLFCLSLYWGAFFVCETIRIGLATALLYVVTSQVFAKRRLLAVIFGLIAISFHYSTVFYLVTIILISYSKYFSKKIFLCSFVIVVLYETISNNVINVAEYVGQIVNLDFFSHYALALEVNEMNTENNVLSPQNIFYHLMGLVLLKGNLHNPYYNKSVQIYYVGLYLGALLSFTPLVMRMQWLFYSQIIWSLFFFAGERCFKTGQKMSVIMIFAIVQIIMIFRQFGGFTLI